LAGGRARLVHQKAVGGFRIHIQEYPNYFQS
jgi:hypothetical protein